MPLTVGTRLGPYEILAPIGAGGMGEVYKARDTRLDRTVAVKVLAQQRSSPEVRQRFEREARTISQLSDPHICALYDVGREGETDYLVMEYLEGEPLSNRLAKGPLPLEQTLRYGIEIANALEKAHRQGIVHRDLKPSNLMVTKTGVKLLDFGLAKAMAPVKPTTDASSLATVTGRSRQPHAGRHGPRDPSVHGAGTGGGSRGGQPQRHLRAGRDPLRDGDGKEGVFRFHAIGAHLRDPARRPEARLADSSRHRRRRWTGSSGRVSPRSRTAAGKAPPTSASSSRGLRKVERTRHRRGPEVSPPLLDGCWVLPRLASWPPPR